MHSLAGSHSRLGPAHLAASSSAFSSCRRRSIRRRTARTKLDTSLVLYLAPNCLRAPVLILVRDAHELAATQSSKCIYHSDRLSHRRVSVRLSDRRQDDRLSYSSYWHGRRGVAAPMLRQRRRRWHETDRRTEGLIKTFSRERLVVVVVFVSLSSLWRTPLRASSGKQRDISLQS